MYSKDYSKRLKDWNASEKYRDEVDFLNSLLAIQSGNKVLDYGCGIGTAIKLLSEKHPQAQVYGYDVNRFEDRVVDDFYIRSDFYFQFDRIYFMHSLAHIPDVVGMLSRLHQFLKPETRVVVITPNSDWLWLKNNCKEVKTDKTVVNHFTSKSLKNTFELAGYKVAMSGMYGELIGLQAERLYIVAKIN
tara:strand:- start:11210 stop:11776 length:567 start_codon:yes stop_codon:yes gene_type:complete